MDGGLAARRFAVQISDPQKNPRRDFSGAGLRPIGRGAEPDRRRRAGAAAEPCKAGGAGAWAVELVKEWMVERIKVPSKKVKKNLKTLFYFWQNSIILVIVWAL